VAEIDSHIATIGKMLWARDGRGSGTGRATVMIGAGFSKNAVPQTGDAREFPMWRDLANQLIDDIEPGCEGCKCLQTNEDTNIICSFGKERRARRRRLAEGATGTSGMMELGQKFEAMKGAALLHGALRRAIPDLEYGPGKAHQDLVRLPWADILTTNWDTLLEQAVDAYDRSYELVVQPKQLAVATAPRIVKLHGCIRSGTKLIFSEEDFRRYPSEFAPFVSLVQQSLMENVFVLIGFSGTDPNFKAWHGWVRDNLGQYLQPIYLVTNKAPDPVDVSLFAGRFVKVVDLSQLGVGDDYRNMLDEFFRRLREARRVFRENLDWPQPQRGSSESATAATLDDWANKLDRRPKWLVLPASNRHLLVRSLRDAIDEADKGTTRAQSDGPHPPRRPSSTMGAALAALFQDRPAHDLRAPYRLDARENAAKVVAHAIELSLARPSEKLLVQLLRPIFAEAVLDILWPDRERASKFSPYEQLIDRIGGNGSQDGRVPSPSVSSSMHVINLGMELLPLMAVLEREARWRGEKTEASALATIPRLFDLSGDGADLHAWATLQSSLDELDSVTAAAVLGEWTPRANEAVSMLRHAAGLRELGRIVECEVETRQALDIVRRVATSPEQHLADASREAWAFAIYSDLLTRNPTVLGPVVDARRRGVTLDIVLQELADRLDELELRRCDPRRELNRLARELDLQELKLELRDARTSALEKSDPEMHWIVADAASSFLVLTETIGLSPWTWTVERGDALGLIAARLFAQDLPDLALTLLLRAGRPSDVPLDGPTFRAFFVGPDTDRRTTNAERVVSSLHRLQSGYVAESEAARDRGELGYVADKITYLLYLLRGIVASPAPTTPPLFRHIWEVACATHDSAVVEMMDTGWAELRMLFQAIIKVFVDEMIAPERVLQTEVFHFLESLLWLAEPRTGSRGELSLRSTDDWPDPFEILAWSDKDRSAAPSGGPRFVLRPAGKKLVDRAKTALRSLRGAALKIQRLRQLQQHLVSSIGSTGQGRDKVLSRRRAVVDALIGRRTGNIEGRRRRGRTGSNPGS
jgi:hypothetical protein